VHHEWLAIDPNNGAYLDSLGWAYFKLNDLENAEKYLMKADRFVKDDPVIYDHLGDLYHKLGDLKKARDYWNKSIRVETEPEEIQKIQKDLEIAEKNLSNNAFMEKAPPEVVDESQCVNCHFCEVVCPDFAIYSVEALADK